RELRAPPFSLSPDALQWLMRQPFPGNVRELENLLHRAAVLAEGSRLEIHDFMEPSINFATSAQAETPPNAAFALDGKLDALQRQEIEQALSAQRWNRSAAARQLGLTPRALRYRLSKLGIA
ncbi:MAG: sigma-54-dependent Fis family transcriptional regulator, partial [Pseudomonadales bacterium]|nr:sigma-54-dependent Fis family transcriptional regulator [Pseudomonadales bacterium]